MAGSGFGVALGLIVAIGAQNAHVLRQGIAGRQLLVTVAVCITCDTILMASGVYGMGRIAIIWPPFEWITRIGGAVFLIGYGVLCFRSALKDRALGSEGQVIESFCPALASILAVTLLNPHVYLDTIVLIGGIGAQYGEDDRLSFTVGAVSASWVWFVALGYGARLLGPTFENPKAWAVLDIGIGILMWSIALTLLL